MLVMGINYKIVSKSGKLLASREHEACYYYLTSKAVDKSVGKVYCYQAPGDIPYTVDEINKWIQYMNDWGFPVQYLGTNFTDYDIDKTYHVFLIEIFDDECNEIYKNKRWFNSALTTLRYLYEPNSINTIPRKFFNALKELPEDTDPFLVFQYVHTLIPAGNSNHMLRTPPVCSLLSREQIEKRLNEKCIPLNSEEFANIHGLWRGPFIPKIKGTKTIEKFNCMANGVLKIFVVGGDDYYARWIENYKLVNTLPEADLVLFTGGADVDPSLYNEPKYKYTSSNIARDMEEKKIFEEARKLDIPMLGICRGSQFLCVMSGGKLVQHQENNSFIHKIFVNSEYKDIYITSTHHQAQYPYNLHYGKYSILAYSNSLSKFHLDGNGKEMNPRFEAEIVRYYDTKCLGIQGHPELPEFLENPKYEASVATLRRILYTFLES